MRLPWQRDKNEITISRKKMFWTGVAVALLQPLFAGLVLGFVLLTEKEAKKEGQIIIVASLIWGLILMWLVPKFGIGLQ